MKKREAKWQTLWNKYLRETRTHGFFELKQTEGKILYFSAVEEHQWESLIAAERTGLVWKLSDEDQRRKPCDCLSIPPLKAYLVIKYPEAFYMIRILKVVALRDSGAPGVTIDDAKRLCDKEVILGK